MALHAKSRSSACPACVLDAHFLARFKVFIGPFCGCTKVTGAGSGRGSLMSNTAGLYSRCPNLIGISSHEICLAVSPMLLN